MRLFNLFQGRQPADVKVRLGLLENWRQFSLLVALNLFVGGMIGLERTILPVLAEAEFGITSKTAAISFIATFGISKALSNLFAGNLAQRVTRRRILIVGWLFGLPVPMILIWAPDWGWVIGANVLLGINQGLTWSMTVLYESGLSNAEHVPSAPGGVGKTTPKRHGSRNGIGVQRSLPCRLQGKVRRGVPD